MPILPALTALSPILGSVGASAANVLNVQNANKQNIALWEKQNAYNHPSQQMARLKEAGLNPNLIYGSSSSGGIASPPPKQEAAKVENPLESINSSTLLRLQMMREQTDLIRAQKELAEVNAKLNWERKVGTSMANTRAGWYFNFVEPQRVEQEFKLKQQAIDYNTRTMEARIDQAINQAKISGLTATEKTTLMPVKQLEAQLAKAGLRPSDPLYMRAIVQLVDWMIKQDMLPKNFNLSPF